MTGLWQVADGDIISVASSGVASRTVKSPSPCGVVRPHSLSECLAASSFREEAGAGGGCPLQVGSPWRMPASLNAHPGKPGSQCTAFTFRGEVKVRAAQCHFPFPQPRKWCPRSRSRSFQIKGQRDYGMRPGEREVRVKGLRSRGAEG